MKKLLLFAWLLSLLGCAESGPMTLDGQNLPESGRKTETLALSLDDALNEFFKALSNPVQDQMPLGA